MNTAPISINVHVGKETPVQAHRTRSGNRVWLEIGPVDASVAVFLDRDGLARVADALGELTELLTA